MRGRMGRKAVLALGCVLLVAVTAACSEDVNPTDQGMTYLEQGDYRKAIDAFDEAIKLDPQDAIAYYNRGVAYYSRDRSEQVRGGLDLYQLAIEDFNDAIQG